MQAVGVVRDGRIRIRLWPQTPSEDFLLSGTHEEPTRLSKRLVSTSTEKKVRSLSNEAILERLASLGMCASTGAFVQVGDRRHSGLAEISLVASSSKAVDQHCYGQPQSSDGPVRTV